MSLGTVVGGAIATTESGLPASTRGPTREVLGGRVVADHRAGRLGAASLQLGQHRGTNAFP